MTSTTRFIIGAYASLPSDPADRDTFYRLLVEQEWVDGLEIPYPGDLANNLAGLAPRLAPSWGTNTITAIPGTMQRLQTNDAFGLASPDAGGRAEALAFTRDIRDRVSELADLTGRPAIRYVQLHSAPTEAASAEAFAESLTELLGWDWSGAEIVIEHCDSHVQGQTPEKGFLTIGEEVDVAVRVGVGIHINWGRSCLEERDADAPLRHIVAAREAGVLRGVLFSGASGEASGYGGPWADGHLPARVDEPVSLMGVGEIRACADAALSGALGYLGAKICVPADASPERRISMLRTVRDALAD